MNLKNIILTVLMLCCIGGCKMSCNKIDNLASEYKAKINALPELTTEQQIKEALESPESKLYVISGYRFPKIESVVKDNCIYYSKSEYKRDEESKKLGRQYESTASQHTEQYGKIFIDETTKLTGITNAIIGGCEVTTEEDYHVNCKYEYEFLQGDQPLWATALIGNHTAKCEGIDGASGSIAGKSKDYLRGNSGHTLYMVITTVTTIAAIVIGFALMSSLTSKKGNVKKKRSRGSR